MVKKKWYLERLGEKVAFKYNMVTCHNKIHIKDHSRDENYEVQRKQKKDGNRN